MAHQIDISDRKCYNCGKEFKKPAELQRHKRRKTPCLIRNIAPEDIHNPNRCIFCNKVFSKPSNLTKHLGSCKIKNGGMNILDDKVRHEEELRVQKEEIFQMKKQMEEMKVELTKMKSETKSTIVNNVNNVSNVSNINNGVINNVTVNFYNYDKPKLDTLKLTPEDLMVDSVFKKLIELIYFNKTIPENHVLYRPNIKEQRLLVYKDGDWKTIIDGGLGPVFNSVKSIAGSEGSFKLDYGGDLYKTDQDFSNLPQVVQSSIKRFFTEEKILDGTIMEIITENREVVKLTMESN